MRSTFGTLLKHSKFSSFDPRISQVYTTHGGDAHRGHWGFKRPLPLRRRGAYITVKHVDTAEHQTEWHSAEPQALWIKGWDELKLSPHQPWFAEDPPVEHLSDSDYVPQSQSPQHWRLPCVPDLDAMSPTAFAQYLAKIRASRRAFLKQRVPPPSLGDAPYRLAPPSAQWHDLIAAHLSRHRRGNPRSTEIEHLPHSSGGLTYAKYSPLQTLLVTKERKGRLADDHKGKDRNLLGYVASFAGMAGFVQRKHAGMGRPVVWDDPNHTGEVMIRPQQVAVKKWPMVVGDRQGLKAARLDLVLRVWDERSHSRSNPHPPGSREYIAAEPPRSVDELSSQVVARRAVAGGRGTTRPGKTLALLRSAMENQ